MTGTWCRAGKTVYPNLIIAGTNKSGTTSLFRYLAAHPDVCPSGIKEIRHFTRNADPLAPEPLQQYSEQFAACAGQSVRLEASPDYLSGGRDVAEAVRQLLPDVKLVFILREPAGRLVSGYRRRKSRDEKTLRGLDLQGYIDGLVRAAEAGSLPADIQSVCYAALLREWLAVFPVEQIAVRFFDDLKSDSSAFVTDLCEFAGIDPAFYAGYEFSIENRTRQVRFRLVHKLVHKLNMAAEPLLNRFPALRRMLRGMYNTVNTSAGGQGAEAADLGALQAVLADDRASLKQLLADNYPGLQLPAWLGNGGKVA